MENFLITNWLSIVIVIIFIIVMFWLWKKGKKKEVKYVIDWLVAEAEKELGDKAGKFKYGHVIDKFYHRLPLIVTIFFTRREINDLIEKAVVELKQYLSEGNNLENKK